MKTARLTVNIIGLLLATSLSIGNALAQSELATEGLRIATGPGNGVYAQLAKDIQKVCNQVVPIVPVPSRGGLDNLMLLSSSQADIGFAQVDLVQQMSKGGDQNIQDLQGVMSMHANLLHVVTRSDGSKIGGTQWNPFAGSVKVLRKFSDLNIKGVRVVLVGSATLMGQSLERQLGYGMTLLQADSDEQAMTMLVNNQADAVFTTGGWPYPSIARQKNTNGIILADFDLQAPAPLAVTRRNYPNLDAFNMNFLASTNLLLTRPFKPNGERGKQVAALKACILRNLDELKEGSYSSVWKEIKNPLDILGVPSFAGADPVGSTTVAATKVKAGSNQVK
jgi:TRAP-type uncharacterized transport system substrate-binding protein